MRYSFCLLSAALVLLAAGLVARAGEWPREVRAYRGSTPALDGVLAPGEWDDATCFTGVKEWAHQFSPTTDDRDLSLVGRVKHDGRRLFFAFDVTDDVLYGIGTKRWLPKENPRAHELSPRGYPWFGDMMELLIDAANRWQGREGAAGDGSSWQMICNVTKSRKGGVGRGGLIEGEPRVVPRAWETYQKWILTGAQEAAVQVKAGGKGYVIEWAVSFDPCLEVAPGRFYSPEMDDVKMGLNIGVGDLDTKTRGKGNFACFHHEDWFAGEKDTRCELRQWGTLRMMAGPRPLEVND